MSCTHPVRGVILVLVFLAVSSGCLDSSASPEQPGAGSPAVLPATPGTGSPGGSRTIPEGTSPPVPADPEEKNISVVREIVKEFHATHTYNATTLYTCARMSEDLWGVLTERGINATMYVGNIHENITSIRDANHAWVMAQVAPDTYVAIETTGGFLVCPDPRFCSQDNPRYYRGFVFASPEDLEDAMEKARHPCPDGYVFGQDRLCHPACGSGYCANGSFCVSGQCRKCPAGSVAGEDLLCHPV